MEGLYGANKFTVLQYMPPHGPFSLLSLLTRATENTS